jgi:AcrR family transcriptional regulator
MTTPTTRPLRRDASINRRRLLAAAHTVFSRDGLEAGVGEVAAEAGVGVGTLYRHFGAKEALIDALVDEFVSDVERATAEAVQQPDGRGLEHYFMAIGEALVTHRACLPRVWESPRAVRLVELRPTVQALLVEAQEHGRIHPAVTRSDIAVLTWSLRSVISTTVGVAPDAWRRHLEVMVSGYRPSAELLHPPLTPEQLEAAEERRHRPC